MNSIGRVAALLLGIFSTPALAETIHGLYKDQHCECCEAHAEYLRNNGFDLKIEAVKNHADRIFRPRWTTPGPEEHRIPQGCAETPGGHG